MFGGRRLILNDYTLSVIVPNYNKEAYLEKCIESITEQSLLPKEIIIVDDCSTDNSIQIIRKLALKYDLIKIISLDKNVGVSRARNIGINAATSQFITTVDSDDFIYNKDKFRNEMALIKQYTGKRVIAYSGIVIVDQSNELVRKVDLSRYKSGKIMNYLLVQRIHEVPRDYIVMRQDVLDTGGYNESMNLYEDLDLLYRLARNHTFVFTNTYGIAYRLVPNGLSRQNYSNHQKQLLILYKKYIKSCNRAQRFSVFVKRKFYLTCMKTKRVFDNLLNKCNEN